MSNYYEHEINRVLNANAPKLPDVKIKLTCGDIESHWLNLNLESIDALRDALDVLESELS